jgi:GxxExxY protein
VYASCLAIEFHRRKIPFEREVALQVTYDGVPLPVSFRADFVCYGAVLIEVKALAQLTAREEAQAINYLKASGLHRAVVLNFGSEVLGKRRLVWRLPTDLDPLRRSVGSGGALVSITDQHVQDKDVGSNRFE